MNKILIYFYILVGLIPYFGTADKIHPQTLYLSILNVLVVVLLLNKYGVKKTLNGLYRSISHKQSLFYLLFAFLSLISVFFAINEIQSYISLTEIFSQFFAFVIIIHLVSTIENIKKFFITSIIILISIELFSTIYPYLEDIYSKGYPIQRSLEYRGVTGSVNVLAYLLLIKLPFIFYLSIKNKKYRWLFIFISIASLYSISVIHLTRSAILVSFLLSISLFIIFYLNSRYDKNDSKFNIKNIFIGVLIPVISTILLSNYQSQVFDRTDSIQSRLSSIDLEDVSTNNRIRYFSHAIKSILKNPIMGVGIGNWQLESIEYDRQNIESYIVPYHVHNDFLEISAEIGLIGGIAYYMVFISVFLFLLKQVITYIKRKKPLDFNVLFLIAIGIYFIDSMVNFPFGRVLQQITLFYFIAVIINFYKLKPLKLNARLPKIIFLIIFLSTPPVIYSSIRLFNSSIDQRIILSHYNLADYSLSKEVMDKMDMEYSDITVTTIPMKSLKGFFYMKNGLYREAIDLFNEGSPRNPYLYFSESYKAFSFLMLEEDDSAAYYSKLAFNKLPGNVVHFANYALSSVVNKDSTALKDAYSKATYKFDTHDEIYLTAMADIIGEDETNFVLEDYQFNAESENEALKKSYVTLKIGTEDLILAAEYHLLAEYYFNQDKFDIAEEYWGLASETNPYEFPYQENYANANLRLGNFEKARKILDELIETNNSKSIKAKYLRGLALLNLKEDELACIDINQIKDLDQFRSIDIGLFCD